MKKLFANALVVFTLALTLVVSGNVTGTEGNANNGAETLSDFPGFFYPQV